MAESIIESKLESEIFGLKVGRYNTDSIDTNIILDNKNKFDIIRVKTSCRDEYAVKKLYDTGLKFYFSGGVRRYQVNCIKAPLPEYTHPEISFTEYSSEYQTHLFEIMKSSWGEYPIGYYRTPIIGEAITKELELQCIFRYYTENYTKENPENFLWIMYLGDKPVGFIALNLITDGVDSTIAGILKEYQNQGLFPNILRFIRRFCRERNLSFFNCGARNENLYSQKAFENDFMRATDVEYIYHIIRM